MTTSVTVSWFWFVRLFFVVFFSYWLVDGSFCFHFRSGFSLNKNRFYLTSSSLKMQIFLRQSDSPKKRRRWEGEGVEVPSGRGFPSDPPSGRRPIRVHRRHSAPPLFDPPPSLHPSAVGASTRQKKTDRLSKSKIN